MFTWELMVFYGMVVKFDNKIIFYSFREVKYLQCCSKTLLSLTQCLRYTFTISKDFVNLRTEDFFVKISFPGSSEGDAYSYLS